MGSCQPLVSIIIPTYNQASLLREAVESVLAQTYENWEAIIVNNYSEDQTAEVVEGFGDPRLTLVNFANQGVVAASRNKGIELARGDYIAFLDSDDWWEPAKLARAVERLEEGRDLVCHGVMFAWDDGRKRYVGCSSDHLARFDNLLYRGNRILTSATVVRKSLLDQVGGFNEDKELITVEDYDLWLRIAQRTDRIGFLPEQLGTYRIHSTNLSKSGLRQFQAENLLLSIYFSREMRHGLRIRIKMRKRYALLHYSTAMMFKESGQVWNALAFFLTALQRNPLLVEAYWESMALCAAQGKDLLRARFKA